MSPEHGSFSLLTRQQWIRLMVGFHCLFFLVLIGMTMMTHRLMIQSTISHVIQPSVTLYQQKGLSPTLVEDLSNHYGYQLSVLTRSDQNAFLPEQVDPAFQDLKPGLVQEIQDQIVLKGRTLSYFDYNRQLFVIVPFDNSSHLGQWLVFGLALPNTGQFMVPLGAFLYLSFMGCFCLLYYLSQRWVGKPLNKISRKVAQLLPSTTDDHQPTQTWTGLFRQVDDLSHQLSYQSATLSTTVSQRSILLNHLPLGIIVIDDQGFVSLSNPAAQSMLSINPKHETHHYSTLIKSYPLNQMIHQVRKNQEAQDQELEFWVPDARTLHVNVVPYSDLGSTSEVLVLLYDLTDIRRLETIRSDFAANASHELRTPITAIKGFAETLHEGAIDDPSVAHQFVDIILLESQRLEKIVTDILDLSQIERQVSSLVTQSIPLIDHLHYLSRTIQKRLTDKQMTLSIEGPHQLTLETDPRRFDHILLNLLHNAINYSDPGKEIIIKVEDRNRLVRISVIDQGYGIAPEDQERIFERFYRVDKARSRQTGGTGLGLSIVRHLVKALNGTISLHSQIGQGSTFTLHLPKSFPHESNEATNEDTQPSKDLTIPHEANEASLQARPS